MGTIRQETNRVGVRIRELLTGDRETVGRLLHTSGAFTIEEQRVALELVDDAIARGLSGDYLAFVAVRDGGVVGYVCLGKTPLTESTWHLYWICVDVRRQGSGIGRALQSHAEAFARSRGAARLVVETSGQSSYARARRFYEVRGYRPVGRIPDFYKAGDDCVVYCGELA